MLEFEWDPTKDLANSRKHGVAFCDAATVFGDPLSIVIFDPDHSGTEDRFITIGNTVTGKLVMGAHTDRGERIRIISARELTRAERRAYEEEIKRRNV